MAARTAQKKAEQTAKELRRVQIGLESERKALSDELRKAKARASELERQMEKANKDAADKEAAASAAEAARKEQTVGGGICMSPSMGVTQGMFPSMGMGMGMGMGQGMGVGQGMGPGMGMGMGMGQGMGVEQGMGIGQGMGMFCFVLFC